jgi:hypothetical protein
MILRSTETAFVRHPLALAVLFDRINRVQVTTSTRFTAAPETAVFPRLKSVLERKPECYCCNVCSVTTAYHTTSKSRRMSCFSFAQRD